jgi:hypothetical protein
MKTKDKDLRVSHEYKVLSIQDSKILQDLSELESFSLGPQIQMKQKSEKLYRDLIMGEDMSLNQNRFTRVH